MSGHDRYLIYKLLGRMVEIKYPAKLGGQRLKGVVEKVYRDIFGNSVELTLGGDTHQFQEPVAIVSDGTTIFFLYGDVDWEDLTDREVFDGAREKAYDSSLNDYLRKTARCPVDKMEFEVGEMKKTPGDRWKRKVALV